MKRIEIKIIVEENQKEDLEMFISDCKAHGFNVTLEGGRHLPSWSGWYAVLKGENWCPLPDVKECDHPFASVQTRCMGEINHCLKCGKDL